MIRKGKRAKRYKFTFVAAAVIVTLVLALLGALIWLYMAANASYVEPPEEPVDVAIIDPNADEDEPQEEDKPDGVLTRKEDAYTFIVAGKQSIGYLTDTMILVYFCPSENALNLMQIPRDTFIDIGYPSSKANALYAYGQGPLMKSALSEAFGIEIDNYAVIGLESFRNIVDLLGGVEIDVPFDMDYEDPAQDLYIHIDKGLQVLDGEQAEGFVRFRYGYNNMDLGRLDAQKMFLTAMAKTMIQPENIAKLPSMFNEVFKNLKTDMPASEMLSMATSALGIPLENVRMFTLPGEPWYHSGESGLTAYKEETMYMINNYFNPYDEMITDAKIVEYGREYVGEILLDGQSLIEIDEDAPDFSLNPKWDWEEYLAQVTGANEPEEDDTESDADADNETEGDSEGDVDSEPTQPSEPTEPTEPTEPEEPSEPTTPEGDGNVIPGGEVLYPTGGGPQS